MAIPRFRPGELYASKRQVREHYREFWKGILVRGKRVAIIHAYKGLARRVHYADQLDPVTMTLTYIGEGKTGDQQLTRGNRALVEAAATGEPVDVFFDCGDIQLAVRANGGLRHLFRLPVQKAAPFWALDGYQNAGKLIIDDRFRGTAEII